MTIDNHQAPLSRKRPSETRVLSSSNHNTAPTTPSAAAAAAAESKLPRLTVKIKRIQAVAQWSWNANDDVCGICHASFEGTAPGVRYPGEDSPVVWGKCGHAYHLQCVSRWLQTSSSKNLCPICRQEWEFGQNPVNNTESNNSNTTTNNNAPTNT
mmetsp:Transcript_1551/g.2193  ORF Transcript_1551/g.2193 Transcript_1551/m.2193 type:complete len:155 (-) Transcript_1551:44-508(-)|eukprot:CAMPEP_0198145410 /NCGR_PEP_ID=MMETSP1443-20131203/23299_1 /TAXON_ID=186043 /ORGANISM="Entomoneis sp., Strain CCMP2396" /LENGTH=154 /DNA_ID=CAMNT_0043809053 /DNA_START=85 /DNA_END=549 /DNA_ORIENTATION=-